MRILLNPLLIDGSGTPAPAVPAQVVPVVAAPSPAAPVVPSEPPKIPMAFDEVQRLFAAERKLNEFESEKQKVLEQKEQERLIAMAKAGEAETALTTQRTSYETRLSTIEGKFHEALKLTALANATGALTFASTEAAAQARQLMSADLEVRELNGQLHVVEKTTGRPASEAIKDWVAMPRYTHFLAAAHKGGAALINNTNPTTPTTGSQAPPTPAGGIPEDRIRDLTAIMRGGPSGNKHSLSNPFNLYSN
jgi:hypothetical protein